MSIPLHLLEAKLKHGRRALVTLERSMHLRAGILRHCLRDRPEAEAYDAYSYRHKGLDWRCHVVVQGAVVRTHAACWWIHGPAGHRQDALDAILFRGALLPLHFDSHFFSRWGRRSEVMGVLITNMMGFFKQYPTVRMYALNQQHRGQEAWAAAIDQGLIHGHKNGTKLLSCDTFISLDMMGPEERQLWERLRMKGDGGQKEA